MWRGLVLLMIIAINVHVARGQQYIGMEGFIHIPSADMDTVLVAHVGAHYVERHMIPDVMKLDGEKYDSWTNYLTIQPFSWIELAYGYTLRKYHKNRNPQQKVGFYSKDRYFSIRIQPIRENKWWPSVVVGGNDVIGSGDGGASTGTDYYRNYYLALTKHIEVKGQLVGLNVAYRKWTESYNSKWNGIVGGLTLQPSFFRPLRIIAEYDGWGVNIGADCTLFKYLMIQCSLQQGRYVSGGACLRVPLGTIHSNKQHEE